MLSMKVIAVASFLLSTVVSASSLRAASTKDIKETSADDECAGQERFNTIMCKSHMCTDCILSWCTEACQKWQLKFPNRRCEDWPESRTSFSTGDFAGKGQFGDQGDYGQKKEE